MKTQKTILWFLSGCVAWITITIAICWLEAQLTIARARDFGLPPPLYFVETITGGVVALFVIILFLTRKANVRLTVGAVVLIFGLAVVCRIISDVTCSFIGPHPSESFMDGFAERVSASGVQAKALAWGDQVLSDPFLNPQDARLVRLPSDKIPSLFTSIIGSVEPLEAIVYYGYEEGQKSAESVRIQADEGVHWGIWISKEPQFSPDWSVPKPRWISERLYVFISYDK